ncbi:VOC family protein [Mycobacterium sp. 1423905.2]|uniref:VOC family protein n=1 Tax=Mycobacterium sp. 1423905.2 TaxID=1856859 RepID=UPI0007FF4BE5|nr:VOC family protein [Mycobacterium sp. 1423905.2]OBJ61769.1 bleomycin resistance protein [Mycobacterium sp. 1423905.2]
MTSVLRPEDLYHTGIVVPDIDAAMARLSALAGYQWTTVQSYTLPFRTGTDRQAQTRELTTSFVYSLQSPYLELIQEVPETPWATSPDSAIHHLGYFTDNLLDTARALERNGFSFELTAAFADPEPALFAYYTDDFGTRIEIVDRSLFPDFPAFLQSQTRDR